MWPQGPGIRHVDRLHELLHDMHLLSAADPEAFQHTYAARARDVVSLIDVMPTEELLHSRGPSLLHLAASCGCLEACARLLQRSGGLNSSTDDAGQIPLFWAARRGLCNTAALLLRAGADVTHTDADGETALHVAASGGFPRLCHLLLGGFSEGILPAARVLGQRTGCGLTPLHVAAAAGHAEVVQALLDAGADVAAATPQRRTPLHLAAMAGHAAAVLRLLEAAPCLVQEVDIEGFTPGDYALERGWSDVVALLGEEVLVQRSLHDTWRARFEPLGRALINARECDAYLELGTPRVRVEFAALHVACRVIDVLHLIHTYTVVVVDSGNVEAAVHFKRTKDQRAFEDIDLVIPRSRLGADIAQDGGLCWLRVVAAVHQDKARKAGVPGQDALSLWSPVISRCR